MSSRTPRALVFQVTLVAVWILFGTLLLKPDWLLDPRGDAVPLAGAVFALLVAGAAALGLAYFSMTKPHGGQIVAVILAVLGLAWFGLGWTIPVLFVLGLVLIAMTAWFSTPTVRILGGALLAALLFLFLRFPLGLLGGAATSAAVGVAAWYWVPHRVLKRVCFMVPSMVLIIFVTTFLMYAAPGSPFAEEKHASDQVLEAKKAAWGLSDDPGEFFHAYTGKILADLDFGPSFKVQGRTVLELLGGAFPVSMSLGILALVIAAGLGLALGIRAGLRPNSWADYSSMGLAVIGISLPNFVIGALLLMGFSLGLGWLPVAGWGGYGHLILPAITLALPFAAYMARLARAGTIEVMQQDFIRTARAKGLSERAVVLKHALRGAILPVVSFLGPAAAGIMTGSFVVETLFGIPGMGQWFVKSAINRDYSVVLGVALIYFSIVIAFNLLVDLAYAWLDPRVREEL